MIKLLPNVHKVESAVISVRRQSGQNGGNLTICFKTV